MSRRAAVLLACVLVAVSSCSAAHRTPTPAAPPYGVHTDVVHDPSTRSIRVWAPAARGSWPVVYALPGDSGQHSDFDRLGPALARRGMVVFATDYRLHGTPQDLTDDLACGYRFARRAADGYGGDLRRPVTGLGYSAGATWMLAGALQRATGPLHTPAGQCVRDLPKPDVVVGVNGCYYAWKGRSQPFPVADMDRREAHVLLIASSADRTCPAWQSKKAAAALSAAGLDTTLTTLRGANHYAPIFHDVVGGSWVSVPEDPAGRRTVQAVLDAVGAAS